MESDFVAKVQASFGPNLTPIQRKHMRFALSNRVRASKVLDEVVAHTGLDLRGKRVLDVGSAYGGFVIQAAQRGAEAWGVEIGKHLHELGKLNAQGEPGAIHQVHADFLSPAVLDVLPRDFDLALVNDVFEHVYDTAALLKQMHTLMKPGAPFMFAIPNPYAVSHLKREGHNGTPGLTLLPPNFWHRLVKGFTCFYHPWSYYSGLFRAMGFERIETWKAKRSSVDNLRAEITAGLARAKEAISKVSMDSKSRLVLNANLTDYERRLADDLAAGDSDYLAWRYLTTFWRGCAFKGGVISADVAEKPRAIDQPRAVTRRLRGLVQHIRELLDGKPRSKEPVIDTSAASMVTLGPELTLVPLALSPPQLTTRWNLRSQTTVTAEGGALRCEVVAEPSGGSHYGGLRVPVARARRIRLDLELIEPAHIEAVYLDGEDGRCGRPLRWKWSQPSTHSTAREVFTLEPGRNGSTFTTVLPVGDAEVAELHLFVRVATGKRAGFVLHGLEASS